MQTCHSELPRECYGCVNWQGRCIHGIEGDITKCFMRVEEEDGTGRLFGGGDDEGD